MGLFGKKVDSDEIRVMHYDGLQGFAQDGVCFLSVNDDAILFRSVKPVVEATLPCSQVLSIDIMPEQNYMAKYRGNAGTTAKFGQKIYVVIQYSSSQGEDRTIALWYVASDIKAGNKLRWLKDQAHKIPVSYTL